METATKYQAEDVSFDDTHIRGLTIAIDFDGTYSEDPRAFDEIVDLLGMRAHTVIMVTQRCEKYESEVRSVIGRGIPIVWASGMTKELAATLAGYSVDIWIDDNPMSVNNALTYRGCLD